MVSQLDIRKGQLYSLDLPGEVAPILTEFRKEMRDGRLMFAREGTDLEIYVTLDDFEQMRCNNKARRLAANAAGEIHDHDIDPLSILDPDDPNITLREREHRLRQHQRLQRAKALRFYVMAYDEQPEIGRGKVSLRALISEHFHAAYAKGLEWKPSPSSVLRAAETCGSPGQRPLSAFFKYRIEHKREKRWPKDIIDAAENAIDYFWSDSKVSMSRALFQYRVEADAIIDAHALPGVERNYPAPSLETVRLWIRNRADWHHWASRYGADNANRRFKARGRAIEATRPLEYVMFDHTRIDAWAVVLDDEGQPLFVARPWLTVAIDTYSRMVLGATLGYEPPSVHSVMTCLRQVVRRKDFLLERFGLHKGATDGWGKPFTVVVDNGKEFVSPSFQATCEAAGIDVIWSPIKMPVHKAYVERLFGTINTMLWHDLPGGLPLTPQQRQLLNLDPEGETVHTRAQLEDAFWNTVVTLYHVETHSGINMAPARKWQQGIAIHKRATVDDVSTLDKFMGKSKRAQLNAEGVTVDGHRFSDPTVTTELMDRLVRLAKERGQRHGVTSSRTVAVRAAYDPGDASRLNIWDPTRRQWITLPNWDRQFTKGLSWYAAKQIKEFARMRNMDFHSDSEKAKARIAHRDFLLEIMPGIKAVERARRARVIEPIKDLVPGDRVEMHTVKEGDEIQHDTAAKRANHSPSVPKGKPFGGKAGARKAAATRKRNKAAQSPGQTSQTSAKPASAKPAAGKPAITKPTAFEEPKADVASIMARVAKRHAPKGDQS